MRMFKIFKKLKSLLSDKILAGLKKKFARTTGPQQPSAEESKSQQTD